MEPEKWTLLAIGSKTTFAFRQWLGKHVPATMDKHAAIEVLLETMFYTRSVQRGYTEDRWGSRDSSVWECVRKITESPFRRD
jgi:hypothetical protein